MMKNKKTVSWILGLLAALITAAVTYCSTSCSLSRSSHVDIDSTHVGHVQIDTSTSSDLHK